MYKDHRSHADNRSPLSHTRNNQATRQVRQSPHTDIKLQKAPAPIQGDLLEATCHQATSKHSGYRPLSGRSSTQIISFTTATIRQRSNQGPQESYSRFYSARASRALPPLGELKIPTRALVLATGLDGTPVASAPE